MSGVVNGYIYKGTTYPNESAVTAAIEKDRATGAASTRVNAGTGAVTNAGTPGSMSGLDSATGNGSGSSGQVYVPNPAGGPMLTQQGFEGERMQGQANTAASQQQQAQIEAQRLAAQATDTSQTGQMRLSADLQAQAEKRRLGYLSSIQSSQPGVQHDDMNAGAEGAARGAAFARAKEQAGQTAVSSLSALRDVIDNHGLMGSSVEAAGTGAAINGAAGATNDFTREQLQQDLARSTQLADLKYQGNITQRGQNLNLIPSLMGLITATGARGLY